LCLCVELITRRALHAPCAAARSCPLRRPASPLALSASSSLAARGLLLTLRKPCGRASLRVLEPVVGGQASFELLRDYVAFELGRRFDLRRRVRKEDTLRSALGPVEGRDPALEPQQPRLHREPLRLSSCLV